MTYFGKMETHKKRSDMTDAQTVKTLKNELNYRIKRAHNVPVYLLEKIKKLESEAKCES